MLQLHTRYTYTYYNTYILIYTRLCVCVYTYTYLYDTTSVHHRVGVYNIIMRFNRVDAIQCCRATATLPVRARVY